MSSQPAAIAAAVADKPRESTHGPDPKRWPLGFYFLKSAVSAVKHNRRSPRIEFYFDGVLAFDLRVDSENPTQFLLVDHLDFERLLDADGAPLDVDAIDDADLPRSERPAFDLIVEANEDEDETAQSLFAREIGGDEAGVGFAIDIVADAFWASLAAAAPSTVGTPTLDASITHWNERDACVETDRRFVDIADTRASAMPVRGEPHDSTVRYSQCGRNVIFLVRTLLRRW